MKAGEPAIGEMADELAIQVTQSKVCIVQTII